MQHCAGSASQAQGESDAMRFFALEDFAGLLRETFDVTFDQQGRAPFVLVEARPLANSPKAIEGLARAPFSLLFHHAAAVVFPQKIYPMQHTALGEFGIFLVPVARDREGFLYQAVFN
jgi:hypothetical protein